MVSGWAARPRFASARRFQWSYVNDWVPAAGTRTFTPSAARACHRQDVGEAEKRNVTPFPLGYIHAVDRMQTEASFTLPSFYLHQRTILAGKRIDVKGVTEAGLNKVRDAVWIR